MIHAVPRTPQNVIPGKRFFLGLFAGRVAGYPTGSTNRVLVFLCVDLIFSFF
jgi:ABC-type dipeptide/oligopeptide/nickel transport system permease subunit